MYIYIYIYIYIGNLPNTTINGLERKQKVTPKYRPPPPPPLPFTQSIQRDQQLTEYIYKTKKSPHCDVIGQIFENFFMYSGRPLSSTITVESFIGPHFDSS